MSDDRESGVEGGAQPPRSRAQELGEYAGRQVGRLQGGYLADASGAKADLARLRKIDPLSDIGVLTAWETIFTDPPERMIGRGDRPSRSERALAAAMHLYAVHQQSKGEPMHRGGIGLGTAIRQLADPTSERDRERPVMRRYHALATASELAETTHHLRGIISQLRASGIALDYARLTKDLYRLDEPSSRTSVRLAWARDLVRASAKKNRDSEPAE